MKKVLVVLACLLLMGTLFANPFEINLGLVGQCNSTLESALETQEFRFDFNDLSFGATAEAKLTIVELNATSLLTKVEGINVLNGVVSANLVLDIFFVRVGAGLGVNYLFDTENGFRLVGGDFFNANLSLRAEVDFLIKDLRIGVYANVPTRFTVENLSSFKYDEAELRDFWKSAVVGLALKTNIF